MCVSTPAQEDSCRHPSLSHPVPTAYGMVARTRVPGHVYNGVSKKSEREVRRCETHLTLPWQQVFDVYDRAIVRSEPEGRIRSVEAHGVLGVVLVSNIFHCS